MIRLVLLPELFKEQKIVFNCDLIFNKRDYETIDKIETCQIYHTLKHLKSYIRNANFGNTCMLVYRLFSSTNAD